MATGQISQRFQIVITGPTDLNVAKTFSVAPSPHSDWGYGFQHRRCHRHFDAYWCHGWYFTADTDAPPIAGAAVIGTNAGATSGGPTQSAAIFAANSQLLAGEVVTVLTSAATITTVWLNCIANLRLPSQ